MSICPSRLRSRTEGNIGEQLRKLAQRYRGAYDTWMECVTELCGEIGVGSRTTDFATRS
ncbi:MAG: hypothetical protein ACRD1Z_11670 [Vicinamibacteria bacterium]